MICTYVVAYPVFYFFLPDIAIVLGYGRTLLNMTLDPGTFEATPCIDDLKFGHFGKFSSRSTIFTYSGELYIA